MYQINRKPLKMAILALFCVFLSLASYFVFTNNSASAADVETYKITLVSSEGNNSINLAYLYYSHDITTADLENIKIEYHRSKGLITPVSIEASMIKLTYGILGSIKVTQITIQKLEFYVPASYNYLFSDGGEGITFYCGDKVLYNSDRLENTIKYCNFTSELMTPDFVVPEPELPIVEEKTKTPWLDKAKEDIKNFFDGLGKYIPKAPNVNWNLIIIFALAFLGIGIYLYFNKKGGKK